MNRSGDPDVIVVGGGISGLAAALRLADRGLTPLVLESAPRVGGRMKTDRREGFSMDLGATLLGGNYHRMRALVERLGLSGKVCPSRIDLGVHRADGRQVASPQTPASVLFGSDLSLAGRVAACRFGLDIVRARGRLGHGDGAARARLDDRSVVDYFDGLGPAGREVLARVIEPGLDAAIGGRVGEVSRAVLFQAIWNFAQPQWSLYGGLGQIPEAIAREVEVRTGARARRIETTARGVEVEAEIDGERHLLRARGAIVALPGHLVPGVCPGLPEWIREPLSRTSFLPVVSAHVALRGPARTPFAMLVFEKEVREGEAIDVADRRSPGNCPDGAGMSAVYFRRSPDFDPLAASERELTERAIRSLEEAFPGTARDVRFVRIQRWKKGVAFFPPGRLSRMARLRRRLARWTAPLDLCGDYLDGPSSEGALVTGEEAADRLGGLLLRSPLPTRVAQVIAG